MGLTTTKNKVGLKKQKQLDKTGDGKITREDLMLLRKSKKKKNGKA